ncbi:MAG: FIST N-terminal domain-containing protein [Cyanobacteria bacterium P01_G01_bin.54]
MFKVVVGHSNDLDTQDAIAQVLAQCQAELGEQTPQAGIVLSAIDFDHGQVLHAIKAAFPDLELIGGTTDGEISSVLGFEEDSLTLMLFCSDRITLRAGIGTQLSQDLDAAVQMAVTHATQRQSEPIRLCLTLPESLTANAVTILAALKAALGSEIPIFGGLTADQWRFKQTYQFHDTNVYSDAIPILTVAGPVVFSHGVASGWQPIGKTGIVTKVEANVVYEIDQKPALKFYQYYIGDRTPSSEYPLAVFEGDRYYMRAPSGQYDAAVGSVTLFGDVPEGATVQITETTRDEILQASQNSMQQALDHYPVGQQPSAAFFFSCASRRQILGRRTQEEYQLAQSCLTQALPSCGFYTNGEIAPLQQQGPTHFHNETFITLLMGEAS